MYLDNQASVVEMGNKGTEHLATDLHEVASIIHTGKQDEYSINAKKQNLAK